MHGKAKLVLIGECLREPVSVPCPSASSEARHSFSHGATGSTRLSTAAPGIEQADVIGNQGVPCLRQVPCQRGLAGPRCTQERHHPITHAHRTGMERQQSPLVAQNSKDIPQKERHAHRAGKPWDVG